MTAQPTIETTDALFVAYENQDNLGVRSLMAVLAENGYRSLLVPFLPGMSDCVIETALRLNPRLVGFSLIFQYTVEEFQRLAQRLRQAGIQAHFTAGGHFPSIRPDQVMELMPELDSIVCYEGEYTLLELLQHLDEPAFWPEVLGLAFRRGGQTTINPPRPLIADLDGLPRLARGPARELSHGVRTASMLASRGCLYDCSFCSIRRFYRGAPGPLRRARSPANVVAEMVSLYEQDGVQFFNFQDDDFAARTPEQRRWLDAFLEELETSGLEGKIIWKIACRVDDVEPGIMRRCQERGLRGVYLGVESGNPAGLKTLNKHVTVEQNRAAILALKSLGIPFEIGFMLFDPSSTFDTVGENIRFLRQMMGDGAAPVNFCKMLPYAGTPIEILLKEEGRLRGSISQPDYAFYDPRLDLYAHFVHLAFQKRNFKYSGLVERLCAGLFDVTLAQFSAKDTWPENDVRALRALVRQVNRSALDVLQAALDYMRARNFLSILDDWEYMTRLSEWEREQEARCEKKLDRLLRRRSPGLARQMDLLRQAADSAQEM